MQLEYLSIVSVLWQSPQPSSFPYQCFGYRCSRFNDAFKGNGVPVKGFQVVSELLCTFIFV